MKPEAPEAADVLDAMKAVLLAAKCGCHEAALEKSNPLCIIAAKRALLRADPAWMTQFFPEDAT